MDTTPKQADRTVLVVEDDPVWQKFFAELIAARGFDVVTVSSSGEAAAACNERCSPPLLVIADVALEDGTDAGLEFVEAVARAAEPPRCIVVTSHGTRENRQRAAAIGALFLLKSDLTRQSFASALAPLLGNETPKPASPTKSKRVATFAEDWCKTAAWWLVAKPI